MSSVKRRLDRSDLHQPNYWQTRAHEVRVSAARAPDDRTRSIMLGFAEGYERLAKQVEKPDAPPVPELANRLLATA